jgi:hypothetical protein
VPVSRPIHLVLATALLLLAACESRLTTQEATETCQELRDRLPLSAADFAECVACFEDCADCEASGTGNVGGGDQAAFVCP